MEGVLVILISVAVSVLISVVIMKVFERGNNSLEKIKRYSEKITGDFNEFVEKRTSDLQEVSTELEVAKQDGKVLLNRFNNLVTDFESKSRGLQERMASIRELEVHVAKSEENMQKLLNLAEHADRNIIEVTREADFVDSLAKKVNQARSELEELNATIPEMQRHFTNIAHEELEQYKGRILGEVEDDIRAIESRLSIAKEETDDLLNNASNRLEELYNSSFEKARQKSNSLEEDAFANLQKMAEKRVSDTRSAFNEDISQLQEMSKNMLGEVVSEIEAFKKECLEKINTYSSNMTNELSNAELALNGNVSQIKTDSDSFNNEMRQTINKNIQNIKDEFASFSSDIEKKIEEIKVQAKADSAEARSALDEFKMEWKGELGSYKGTLTADFANLELLLKNRVEEIKAIEKQSNFELKEYIDGNNKSLREAQESLSRNIKDAIEKDKSYVDVFKANWESEAAALTERIRSNFAESESEINSKSSLLIQKMNEAEKALQETTAYLEAEFKNGERNSTEQLKMMLLSLQENIDSLSEQADKKVADFKMQIEARFKKFESLISGTDLMQEELEKAMANTQEKIRDEFARNVTLIKMEQQTFAKNFDAETNKLKERLADIDSGIELIKDKAFENVSQRLGSFEKDFFSNLSKRSEEINNNFETMKADVKEKLELLANEKEAERREIEDAYKAELKERVERLEDEYKGGFADIEQKVQDIENSLSNRILASDDSISKHAESLKSDINVAIDKARQYLDKELADYKVSLQDSLSAHYFDLEAAAKDLKAKIDEANISSNVEFENLKGNFETWRSGIEQKFDSSKSMFENKLKRIESVTSDAMEGLTAKYDGQYSELLQKNDELFDGVKERIAELDGKLDLATDQFKKEAESFSLNVDSQLKNAFALIEQKVSESHADTNGAVENVRSLIHTLKEHLNEIQEKTTLQIQSDAERLNAIIEEIEKKQNAFIAQTQIFEKADELKLELEKSIEKLKAEVSHFEVYRTAMDEITNQYNRVCKIEGEIEGKISSIMNERGRIERVEGQFARLDDVANVIERKIDVLKNTGDNIQAYEVQVRKVEESIEKMNARYDRLEKKNIVLDQTAESIGEAFENLKVLESEIKAFKSDVAFLPTEIENLKASMQALSFNKDKADAVFSKLSALDDMLTQTESKMSHLQDSRSWLAAVETRLTDLSSKTDEKMKLLSSLYKGEPSQRKESGAPALSTRESVISLHRQGWKVDEIANALKLSRGEVDLIIEHSDRMI